MASGTVVSPVRVSANHLSLHAGGFDVVHRPPSPGSL